MYQIHSALQRMIQGETRTENRVRENSTCGFTLIELLIVVAIIGILVSILLPTLARVKYKAKLVVCMNNLRQVGASGLMYANENSSRFPDRKSANHSGWGMPAIAARVERRRVVPNLDDRPLLMSLSLDELNCPFDPVLDWYDFDTSTSLLMTYSVYYGWNSSNNVNLLKLGRAMRYNGNEFDILASDTLFDRAGLSYVASSHPDRGTGYLQQHSARPWWYGDPPSHGPLDLNYCRTDGSILSLKDVLDRDSRLTGVPYKIGTNIRAVLLPDITVSE